MGEKRTLALRRPQGCLCRRVDPPITDGLTIPGHIKIDVDGLVHRVIKGMVETLQRPELKTLLIEINLDNPKSLAIIEQITNLGCSFSCDLLRITGR